MKCIFSCVSHFLTFVLATEAANEPLRMIASQIFSFCILWYWDEGNNFLVSSYFSSYNPEITSNTYIIDWTRKSVKIYGNCNSKAFLIYDFSD